MKRDMHDYRMVSLYSFICCLFVDDDARYSGPQILKSVSTTKCVSTTVESPIKEVLHDLLNCLIAEYNYQDDGKLFIETLQYKIDQYTCRKVCFGCYMKLCCICFEN